MTPEDKEVEINEGKDNERATKYKLTNGPKLNLTKHLLKLLTKMLML